ncbi:hypothetical protein ABMC89_09235 [Sulfitobacter sp. HNIBRBA3233]|uniref:hypothetical protein n=1 Tax=Sulfitobacter marinivivus TaxID=3158558 RepID=UPI0032DF694A
MSLVTMPPGDRFIASSADILNEYGIGLEVGYDFEMYRKHLAKARPDHTLGAPFDPLLQDIRPGNAFWIIGRNREGDIIHTQALRMLSLAEMTVADYLAANFRAFPPSDVDLDLPRSRYRAGPGARRMTGQVAYHGEFWIGGADKQFRGQGVSCVLGRYGFWEAIQHWDPDHIIAFILKPVAFKGLVERAGWMHTDPCALRWFERDNEIPMETFMAYMHREDLSFLLELPLRELFAMAA